LTMVMEYVGSTQEEQAVEMEKAVTVREAAQHSQQSQSKTIFSFNDSL